MKKRRYYWIILSVILIALIVGGGFLLFQYRPKTLIPHDLEIDFLDVGQGDAILIITPAGKNILIDGGPDTTVIKKLNIFLKNKSQIIDLMILTHPHADHINGLIEVLKYYSVKKVIATTVNYQNGSWHYFLEEIAKERIPLSQINTPENVLLETNCNFNILAPLNPLFLETQKKLNNTSIVGRLDCQGLKVLFTGDAEKELETALLKAYPPAELQAMILKVGHHGSATASTLQFLQAVNPQTAIIEVGNGNKYGFPIPITLSKLQKIGATIYRTDLNGDIQIINKNRLKVEIKAWGQVGD